MGMAEALLFFFWNRKVQHVTEIFYKVDLEDVLDENQTI